MRLVFFGAKATSKTTRDLFGKKNCYKMQVPSLGFSFCEACEAQNGQETPSTHIALRCGRWCCFGFAMLLRAGLRALLLYDLLLVFASETSVSSACWPRPSLRSYCCNATTREKMQECFSGLYTYENLGLLSDLFRWLKWGDFPSVRQIVCQVLILFCFLFLFFSCFFTGKTEH